MKSTCKRGANDVVRASASAPMDRHSRSPEVVKGQAGGRPALAFCLFTGGGRRGWQQLLLGLAVARSHAVHRCPVDALWRWPAGAIPSMSSWVRVARARDAER
jgi:hypothetical protein